CDVNGRSGTLPNPAGQGVRAAPAEGCHRKATACRRNPSRRSLPFPRPATSRRGVPNTGPPGSASTPFADRRHLGRRGLTSLVISPVPAQPLFEPCDLFPLPHLRHVDCPPPLQPRGLVGSQVRHQVRRERLPCRLRFLLRRPLL